MSSQQREQAPSIGSIQAPAMAGTATSKKEPQFPGSAQQHARRSPAQRTWAAQQGAHSIRLSTVGAAGTPAGLLTTTKSGVLATTRS